MWPMVYATALPQFGTFDASLIDGTLPVARPHPETTEPLPYWPSYHDASPQQRSRYLDWLADGRSDPQIEIGYLFIYFYGLERRTIVDDADHAAIVEEVLRLRGIYRASRSFQRYATALLWLILSLTRTRRLLSEDLVAKVLTTTERWDEEFLNNYLAYLYATGLNLKADMAFVVAQHDHRTPTSVIVRRHEQRFRELFDKNLSSSFQAV